MTPEEEARFDKMEKRLDEYDKLMFGHLGPNNVWIDGFTQSVADTVTMVKQIKSWGSVIAVAILGQLVILLAHQFWPVH